MTHDSTADDRRLLGHLKHGSEEQVNRALRRLMDLYSDELVRRAWRDLGDEDLAQDVVQKAFIRLWEGRRRLRWWGSIRAYLHTVVGNEVIDLLRKRRVRQRAAEEQKLLTRPRPATPAEDLEMTMLLDRYDAVVAALPRRQRDVYELCVHQCLTYKEAAKVLGKRPKTAANLLSEALRTVKDRMGLGK